MTRAEATTDAAQPVFARRRRRLPRGWRSLSVYVLILGVFIFTGIFADLIAPHDPVRDDLQGRLQGPFWQSDGSFEHPLGTDGLGRDTLSRVIHGARLSLIVVATTIPTALVIGVMLGLFSGWRLGFADRFLMRVVDMQLAFPGILFAVLLASLYGPSLRNVIIVLTVFMWAAFARLVRGEVLSLRERDFVLAARTVGASDLRIMLRYLLPNLLNPVIVLATLLVADAIISEAGLSFIGVGVAPDSVSWGIMISDGRTFLGLDFWQVGMPGFAILTVSLVANLLGDWVRDWLDPRLRRAA